MPSDENREPVFLLDECLNPRVAEALRCVEYKVTSVRDIFERPKVDDPELISWCKVNDSTWITADIKARKQYKRTLLTSKIRCLWVYRRKGQMSTKEQLRVLSYVLPDLIERFSLQPQELHYRARVHGLSPKEGIKLEEISLVQHL